MSTKILHVLENGFCRKLCDIPNGANALVHTGQTKSVFFTNPDDNNIGVVHTSSENPTAEIWFEKHDFNSPKALCIAPNGNTLYVEEPEGMIRGVRITSPTSFKQVGLHGKQQYRAMIRSTRKMAKRVNGMICLADGDVLLADDQRHLILRNVNSRYEKYIGSGVPEFAVSPQPFNTSLFSPCGLAYHRKTNTLYVSDTGNHVIRVFKDRKEKHLIGRPKQDGDKDNDQSTSTFCEPTDIAASHNALYIIDGCSTRIRRFDMQTGLVTTVYKSDYHLLSIACSDKEHVVFIEHQNI